MINQWKIGTVSLKKLRVLVAVITIIIVGCARQQQSTNLSPNSNCWVRSSCAELVLYRPSSAWADAEWQAPVVYVNEAYVGSLASATAIAIKLQPGFHQIRFRRPLLGIVRVPGWDFGKYLDISLEVTVKQQTLYRYQEVPYKEQWSPSSRGFVREQRWTQAVLAQLKDGYHWLQPQQSVYLASLEEENRQIFGVGVTQGALPIEP